MNAGHATTKARMVSSMSNWLRRLKSGENINIRVLTVFRAHRTKLALSILIISTVDAKALTS